MGFKVRNITNILGQTNKSPLNLFFVDLEPAENNKQIFELKYLFNMKIAIEPPHKSTNIVQCTRCQTYGHTKAYCTHPFACVKCGGDHSTSSCSKSQDLPATCALCDGPHPANYKGCTVYKDLQNLRKNKPTAQQRQPNSNPNHATTTVLTTQTSHNNISAPHTSRSVLSQDFTNLFNLFGTNFIVGRNWNAKHTFWGSRLISPKGRALYSTTRAGSFKFLTTGEPTHWPTGPAKRPDVIDFFVTCGLANNYTHIERRDELSSDHSPLVLTLSSTVIIKPKPPRLTTHKTNWDAFKYYIEENVNLNLKPDSHYSASQGPVTVR
ncbi:hypothetical protein M8J77_020854 [Diaphorina citri]|nr:hypothetical protein M8J77_020854 [Diaphorina citri]